MTSETIRESIGLRCTTFDVPMEDDFYGELADRLSFNDRVLNDTPIPFSASTRYLFG